MEQDGTRWQQGGMPPKPLVPLANEAQQAGGFGTLLKNKPLPPKSGII
jgi:hypothetical protein